MIEVNIRKNPIPQIFAMLKPPRTGQLFRTVGAMVSRKARDNARAKGGRRFWSEIADSVRYESDDTRAVIGASHVASAQKQFGGTIAAPGKGSGSRGAKALTIPIAEEARGKNAGDFNNLFRPKGMNVLFRKLGDGNIQPLFALVKSVNQDPDPFMPEGQQLDNEIRSAAQVFFRKLGAKG